MLIRKHGKVGTKGQKLTGEIHRLVKFTNLCISPVRDQLTHTIK